MKQNKIKNKTTEHDSATFLFCTFIRILRSSTYLLANFSKHATVCTSLILQASKGAGLIGLLLTGVEQVGGGIMQIILTLRQFMLGADKHWALSAPDGFSDWNSLAQAFPCGVQTVQKMCVCHACVIMYFRDVP